MIEFLKSMMHFALNDGNPEKNNVFDYSENDCYRF